MLMADTTAPLSRWTVNGTFPKKECGAWSRAHDWTRCISADDLARAKAVHVAGWLLMMAPHDDATAPLAQWAITRVPDFDSDGPIPPKAQWATSYNFSSENACKAYRTCLCSGCLLPGTVIRQPSIFNWWHDMRERRRQQRKFLALRCVPDDDPSLKAK